MPHAKGGVVLSLTGGDPQAPFSMHNFVGGNAFMLNILKYYGEEQEVTAATEHFDATIGRVHEQLENNTARVVIQDPRVSDQTLMADIVIENLAGHKFPTGFPSRRAWLHVTVTDKDGGVLFESGAVMDDGSIVGNENDADASSYEPHYATISTADQVQLYEPIMVNTDGEVTTTLLRAAGLAKDNRLLPVGFDKVGAPADVAVYGAALADEDMEGGGDRVQYQIDLGGATGPFKLQVELLYQSVGYRWARNLSENEGDLVERFWSYYQEIPNIPLTVANAMAEVE
jgi:hypothetical protein